MMRYPPTAPDQSLTPFRMQNVEKFTLPFGPNTSNQYGVAAAGAAGTILGGIAPAQASGFNGYSQGLAGLGTSYANTYGSYAGALGNIATAQANNNSNQYGARAMAEAARQGAVGNIGSAALGAYGSATNSALSAWAQNQTAYNKSLSEMQQASQQGLSNYGVSRNQALGNLGGSYAEAGGRLGASSALGNFNFNFDGGGGGGGFSASGPSGGIASGTFGGSGSSGSLTRDGGTSALSGIVDNTFNGLGETRTGLMSRDLLDDMRRDADIGRERLDAQHYSSRNMPSQMLDQSLAGLLMMSRDGYDQSGMGMNQFYDSVAEAESRAPRANYDGILGMLQDGYRNSGGQLDVLRTDLNSGYDKFRTAVGSVFSSDPIADIRTAREAELLRRTYAEEDRLKSEAAAAPARERARRETDAYRRAGWTWAGGEGWRPAAGTRRDRSGGFTLPEEVRQLYGI